MVSRNTSRSYGPCFAAYIEERAAVLAAESRAQSAEQATLRADVPTRENRNSTEGDHALQVELVEDWEIERLDHEISSPTHATSSLSSYKAQNHQNFGAKKRQEYPLARFQNPTNNPEVALLLERYGDIRGVMLNHPTFRRIQRPKAEGGWATDLAGLIYLAKTYTLERVLRAVKVTNDYRGARDKGAVFNHAVRKGLEVVD